MSEIAAPVLKWAGGKRALLAQYEPRLPTTFRAYHEPFVGGGAVFFHLRPRLEQTAHLSDVNAELINLYQALRDELPAVTKRLEEHRRRHSSDYYYKIRSVHPDKLDPTRRAARLIYLNRTCYNGLYRVNARGYFNVPLGRYTNPTILDRERLQAASSALQGVELHQETFELVLERAVEGDLVYFDPPYQPLTRTANFTSYTADSFTESDQARLAEVYRELDRRGVQLLLSNSDTPLVRKLFRGFTLHEIQAPRFINSKASLRKAVGELLVSNLEPALARPGKKPALAACT
ncbi:DNA adenine methylase [bacterium CPR1]|nr:DNA adenine methylase [bacterium CPR1]